MPWSWPCIADGSGWSTFTTPWTSGTCSRSAFSIPIRSVIRLDGHVPQAPWSLRLTILFSYETNSQSPPSRWRYGRISSRIAWIFCSSVGAAAGAAVKPAPVSGAVMRRLRGDRPEDSRPRAPSPRCAIGRGLLPELREDALEARLQALGRRPLDERVLVGVDDPGLGAQDLGTPHEHRRRLGERRRRRGQRRLPAGHGRLRAQLALAGHDGLEDLPLELVLEDPRRVGRERRLVRLDLRGRRQRAVRRRGGGRGGRDPRERARRRARGE